MSVLRKFLGPSREEIWRQIANEIKGEYIDTGFWKSDRLEFKHKEWTMVLDTFAKQQGNHHATYTRMRAPFVNKDQFYFDIYREGFFSSVSKFFGMQDIEVGDSLFDEDFIIKSSDEEKVKKLLKDNKLRKLISDQPRIHLEIKYDSDSFFRSEFPTGVHMLYFECLGVIKDKKDLRDLFLLFCVVLERLVQMDSAYENDPDIEL